MGCRVLPLNDADTPEEPIAVRACQTDRDSLFDEGRGCELTDDDRTDIAAGVGCNEGLRTRPRRGAGNERPPALRTSGRSFPAPDRGAPWAA